LDNKYKRDDAEFDQLLGIELRCQFCEDCDNFVSGALVKSALGEHTQTWCEQLGVEVGDELLGFLLRQSEPRGPAGFQDRLTASKPPILATM